MGRILSFPAQLGVASLSLVNGPAARNSGRNTAVTGRETTFATLGDIIELSLSFVPAKERRARQQRGLMIASMGGANAIRLPLIDPDAYRFEELNDTTFENGTVPSNGKSLKPSPPLVPVNVGVYSEGSAVVGLRPGRFWANDLEVGDWIGFVGHFGWYMITGKVSGTPSEYFIWPTLRRTVRTTDYCTRNPVLVCRTRPGGISINRGGQSTQGQSLALFEVIDPDVRSAFRDW